MLYTMQHKLVLCFIYLWRYWFELLKSACLLKNWLKLTVFATQLLSTVVYWCYFNGMLLAAVYRVEIRQLIFVANGQMFTKIYRNDWYWYLLFSEMFAIKVTSWPKLRRILKALWPFKFYGCRFTKSCNLQEKFETNKCFAYYHSDVL